MPNHKLKRQKKMGEKPIILLPVVAPEPHMKSRTPSDSAIVAIFQDKRKPAEGLKHAFPLDFTAIFGPDGGKKRIAQGVQHACVVQKKSTPQNENSGRKIRMQNSGRDPLVI